MSISLTYMYVTLKCHDINIMYNVISIFPCEGFSGFSGGSQSSVAGYGQLPFPAASQTHLRSRIEGR